MNRRRHSRGSEISVYGEAELHRSARGLASSLAGAGSLHSHVVYGVDADPSGLQKPVYGLRSPEREKRPRIGNRLISTPQRDVAMPMNGGIHIDTRPVDFFVTGFGFWYIGGVIL